MRRYLINTVFEPIADDWHPDKILAVLFHRSAALLYLVYFLWGIASIIGRIPWLVAAQGDLIQTFLSGLVCVVATLAFTGALRFPLLARLEMFSAASLAAVVLIYQLFMVMALFNTQNLAFIPNLILNFSYFIVTLTRVVFIYRTLIKQARRET